MYTIRIFWTCTSKRWVKKYDFFYYFTSPAFSDFLFYASKEGKWKSFNIYRQYYNFVFRARFWCIIPIRLYIFNPLPKQQRLYF